MRPAAALLRLCPKHARPRACGLLTPARTSPLLSLPLIVLLSLQCFSGLPLLSPKQKTFIVMDKDELRERLKAAVAQVRRAHVGRRSG